MVIKQAAFIFPREQESVQAFATQWKMGDEANRLLVNIYSALRFYRVYGPPPTSSHGASFQRLGH